MFHYGKLTGLCRAISRQSIRRGEHSGKSAKTNVFNQFKCGQPTAETHPHLLRKGEIQPNITIAEFQQRRQKLAELIIANTKLDFKNNLIIIPSATKKYMSDKIPYVFRQDTDYLYLTGSLEPDSCLVINTSQKSSYWSTLFVRNPDPHAEQWDGPRTNVDSALLLFGVDQALPMSDLEKFLTSFISSNKPCTIWFDIFDNTMPQPHIKRIVKELSRNAAVAQMEKPKQYIHRLRMIKSAGEIGLMEQSCKITSKAINDTIIISESKINEHQLFAKVDYECRKNGAEYLAYPPVVAGGDRATIIHYINNNQRIYDGQLVLMDAGCEYHGYSSDITRTWPINGRFSNEQKLIYEVVHDVQCELIKQLYLYPSLDELYEYMCELLKKYLKEIGLISKNAPTHSIYKMVHAFCPHHVSHYLGMDVHDTNLISRNIKMQTGMIITVEPGIYIPHHLDVPQEFKGIGIRIEDDVLITENGPVVLTKDCVKYVSDIENLMLFST